MKQTCYVCQNIDCQNRGSAALLQELKEQVAAKGVDVEVKEYICFGGCDFGPNIVVHPQKNWYAGVKKDDLPEIVASMAGGPAVTRLDTIDPSLKEIIYSLLDSGAA